jgi:SAM-dependent methyltransferase
MPALDNSYWQERLRNRSGTRYAEAWRDRYIDGAWKRALRKAFSRMKGVRSVLDVGCGDGHIGSWLQQQFGVKVFGVDAYEWNGTNALHGFAVVDAEAKGAFRAVAGGKRFDVAMTTTVLAHTENWRAIVDNMIEVARYLVILENLQSPVPAWQVGLSYKRPLPWPELTELAKSRGLQLELWEPVTVIDTRLFKYLPTWLAHRVTAPLDWLATKWVRASDARQQLCVFKVPERGESAVTGGQAAATTGNPGERR